MSRKKQLALDFFNFVLSFLICRWVFMEYFYFYSLSVFGLASENVDFIRSLALVLIMTAILFLALRLLYVHHIRKWVLYLLYTCYGVLLAYLLFFKSIGIQGANFDLISYLSDTVTIDARVPFFNLLLFIPLGLLFPFKPITVGSFVLGITLVEASQYFFYLGFFDIGDIVTNTLSFMIGTYLYRTRLGRQIQRSFHVSST